MTRPGIKRSKRKAPDVVLLTPDQFEEFAQHMANPPPQTEAMKAAAQLRQEMLRPTLRERLAGWIRSIGARLMNVGR